MKILFITQHFPPEVGAASTRIFETAKHLRSFGHEVLVLTAFPNYLLSEPIKKYKGKFSYDEEIEGIRVYRSYIYSNLKLPLLLSRFCGFLSFMISSILRGFSLEKVDILIATSPPFSVGISGFIISQLKGAKFVFEVRDLYPDSAIELGVIKSRFLIKILRKVEDYLYSKANLLVALTKGILNHFKQLGKERKSILITNGVDIDLFSNCKRDGSDLKINIDSNFVLLNIGILGRVHSLETILESLALLKNEDISLFFIGEGVEEEKLKLKARNLNLKNVSFLQNQKRKYIPLLISQSDICFVTTKKLELTKGTLPVKMFEYMACGKPIVAAVHGEAADLINEAKAGIVVEPGNSKQMAEVILRLYKNPNLRIEMGQNGKEFVIKNYCRETLVRKYEKSLKKLID